MISDLKLGNYFIKFFIYVNLLKIKKIFLIEPIQEQKEDKIC